MGRPMTLMLLLCFMFNLTVQYHTSTRSSWGRPEYTLSPNFQINAEPTTRHYKLVVTNTTSSPDGFLRTVLVVNNQMPAPLIEGNEGDTFVITVVNLIDEPLSIHWHGLHQNGTNWEDGITAVTQCPIAPRTKYTYTFTVNNQFGTYWYHAHTMNLKADGLVGPLIIHSRRDPLKRGIDFDEEVVLILQDWYHDTSVDIVRQLRSPQGYMNSTAAPSPNSALMNGVGQWNCRFATRYERCSPKSPIEFTFFAGTKIRFRLIQASSIALFNWSADQHLLNVTEADATPVHGPSGIQRIKLHAGQRYSAIVTLGENEADSSFYLRGIMEDDCWSWVRGDIQLTAYAIVRVVKPGTWSPRNAGYPKTQDWTAQPDGRCVDLNPDELMPILPVSPPPRVKAIGSFTSGFGFQSIATGLPVPPAPPANPPTSGAPGIQKRQTFITPSDYYKLPFGTASGPAEITQNAAPPPTPLATQPRFFVNNVTWSAFPQQPVLHDLTPGGIGMVNSTRVANLVCPTADWYDLYLVNSDQALNHPFHLHGMDMHLVAAGRGTPTPENLAKLKYRTENPLRRDTIVVEGGSFVVARILCDLPGVWMMHCHMGWHLSGGFAGVVAVQPERIASFKIPQKNKDLCLAGPRGEMISG